MSGHTPGRHTAGPWSITHETDIIGTENDPENGCCGVVDVAHVYMRTVPGRTDANASLIAAAPELLEALKKLLSGMFDGPDESDAAALVAKARAAIAKAEGGAA